MYFAIIILLMLVLPVGSTLIEYLTTGGDLVLLEGKWFTFWAVGIRLLVAGLNQVVRPSFTSKGIFGMADTSAEKIVRELGYANVGIGLIGTLSLLQPAFILPAAIAGGLFLGLAGLEHVASGKRNTNETLAMVSDLFVFAVLLIYVLRLAFF